MLAICCFAAASIGLSARWWPYAPHDYEECSEKAETAASSEDERASLLTQCGVQFMGRRKWGGGYSYHDFTQNRHFDIAGPNPSPEELKQIDHEYIAYLALQRRDAIAAAFAKKQSERTQTDPEADQKSTGSLPDVGPPMVITPTKLPVTGRPSHRNLLLPANLNSRTSLGVPSELIDSHSAAASSI